MKKITIVCLCILMLFATSACNNHISDDQPWPMGVKPEELYKKDGISDIGHVYGAYYWFNYDQKFYFCKVSLNDPFVIESFKINIPLGVCTEETINDVHVGDTIELVLAKLGLPTQDGSASSYISSIFETESGVFCEIKWNADSDFNFIVREIITR